MLSNNVDIKDKKIIQNEKRRQQTEITEENIKHHSFVTLYLTLFLGETSQTAGQVTSVRRAISFSLNKPGYLRTEIWKND